MKAIWIALIPILLLAESITEKKASFAQKPDARFTDSQYINRELHALKKKLYDSYEKAQKLATANTDDTELPP